MGTPGLRLIQELLAKSVAKWSGDAANKTEDSNAENEERKTAAIKAEKQEFPTSIMLTMSASSKHVNELSGSSNSEKGKRKREDGVLRKKKKIKSNHSEIFAEDLQHTNVKKEIKVEYTEPEYVKIIKNEPNTCMENAEEESLISKWLKKSVVKYSESLHQDEIKFENLDKHSCHKMEIKKENVELKYILKPKIKKEKIQKNVRILNSKTEGGNGERNRSILKSKLNAEKVDESPVQKCKRKKPKVLYSPEEDKVILDAMETFGENLNIGKLAKQLVNRCHGSVHAHIKVLKNGPRRRSPFSLVEDQVILDTALMGLASKTLKELSLRSDGETQAAASAIGRDRGDILACRWSRRLKPWILQHYSGTLNLDIRRMLANHLNET